MIQTLQLIKFVYPFILLALFFWLYRKDYKIMRRFYRRMTISISARKLYILTTLCALLFINWCCCTTAPNYAVIMGAFITVCFFFYRVADRILHRLHESNRLTLITFMLAMVCLAIPYMNSIFHVLFTIGVASTFYPSERVLRIKDEKNYKSNSPEFLDKILKKYF